MDNIFKKVDKTVAVSIFGGVIVSALVFSKSTKKRIRENIIRIAKSYYGKKEIPQNKGFFDKNFEAEMKAVGFVSGMEWCALFVKLVVLKAFYYNPVRNNLLNKKMNGSTQLTFDFFSKNKGFWKVSITPKVGSIVNWRSVETPASGHFGIVYEVKKNEFYTIEGNKNNQVDVVKHNISEMDKTTGLKLIGFVEFLK